MHNRIHFTDIGQKLITQPLPYLRLLRPQYQQTQAVPGQLLRTEQFLQSAANVHPGQLHAPVGSIVQKEIGRLGRRRCR